MSEHYANNALQNYATMHSAECEKWAKVLAKPPKPAPKKKNKKESDFSVFWFIIKS